MTEIDTESDSDESDDDNNDVKQSEFNRLCSPHKFSSKQSTLFEN